MKLLQINSVCGIGSTGRIATDIHSIMIAQGHESYIAYGRDEAINCENTLKIGNKYDNYTHVALTRIFDKHGFGSKRATEEFIRKIEVLNPDIIHLHNIHGYYLNIKVLFEYLKRSKKPVIWTLHDCWAFTGHCAYFDYVECDKWKTGCSLCPQKNAYPASQFSDNSNANYFKKRDIFNGVENMILVAPSKWLGNLVSESYFREYPIQVINNGIDLEVFHPTESDFRTKNNLNDKFIILGVASIWEERKGYQYFLELSSKLKKDEIIVLVGISEQQKKSMPNNILGISKTKNVQHLVEIYSSANVFVNPTLEDNFPTTNLEALACGTPIITFDTGGSTESIDSSCGLVVKKGNVTELYEGIKKVRSNKKSNYKDGCVERAKEFYDKNDRFNEYIELYGRM